MSTVGPGRRWGIRGARAAAAGLTGSRRTPAPPGRPMRASFLPSGVQRNTVSGQFYQPMADEHVGSGTRACPGDVNKLYASACRTVAVINNNAMAIIGVIIIVVTVFQLTSWAPSGGKTRHSPLLLGQIIV